MIERRIEIDTQDGPMATFVCHPERHGPHPVVIFLMDAPGIREELRDMVRRLAAAGYYVLLPNLYHRFDVEELGNFLGVEGRPVMQQIGGLMGQLSRAMVMEDVDAILAFLGSDPAASAGPVGVMGYCMSGQHAVAAAHRHPDRVAAAASFYGTHLVTDQPDSPHVLAASTPAELYFAWAELDNWAPLAMAEPLRAALSAAGANAEVEIYPGVDHGFAFPARSVYDREASERHWERLFALFARTLRP